MLSQPGTIRTVLAIAGMKDNASREIVAEALEAAPGVLEVHVSLLRASAMVWHDGGHAGDLVRAVEKAGFGASLAPGAATSVHEQGEP